MVNGKIGHIQWGAVGAAAFFLLWLNGCGDFFSDKRTVIQTNEIFRELSQINVVSDVNRPMPPHYTPEPLVVAEANSVTVFYFSRQMPPATLATLVSEQLGYKAGKDAAGQPFGCVSTNESTNQLVIKCRTAEEADSLLGFLDEVDVAPVQVRVDCIISEVFADLTLDYETTVIIEDLFGEDFTIDSFLPGASIRAPDRAAIGMKAGISKDDLTAIIDVLQSRGYAKILMRPSLEVVNGTTARIETNEEVPIPEQILSGGDIITTIQYKEVIDYLQVTPHVYSDGTIGLTTEAGISSRTVPEGVTQAPIITKRTIKNQENRLEKGQSLVVGGIIKTERVSVVRGVPFIRDIPLLGILFSSKDFEDRAKEILFVLTPSISSNGTDHSRMVANVRRKHAMPEYKRGFEDFFTDPLGIGAYTEQVELQAAEAQFERLRAEIQRTEALVEVDEVKAKLLDTVEEVAAERAKADLLRIEAQKARELAEKSTAEAEKMMAEAQKTQAEAQKAKSEAQEIKAQAHKAKAETPKQEAPTEGAGKAEPDKPAAPAPAEAAPKPEAPANPAPPAQAAPPAPEQEKPAPDASNTPENTPPADAKGASATSGAS